MASEEVIISLNNVEKSFGDFFAVDHVSLDIKKGQFVTILGPSGCGKTTTLRMIGGFELPTGGTILLNNSDITKLPPYKRPINTVFQRYALFPHLNVFDNVAFGLRFKKVPVVVTNKKGEKVTKMKHFKMDQITEMVQKALKVVGLDELSERDITTLSGGQQQRVAIARCIVNKPEILLLDEPLGALDLKMRKDMQIELKEMHKKLGITFIYVTHDQEEALTMSDVIVVMNHGVIQQVGTPEEIYNEPANAFVADFIGESNIYNAVMTGKKVVKFLGKEFKCVDDFPLDERVDVVVRPEDVILGKPNKGKVNGEIVSKVFKGVHYEYVINIGKNELIAKSTEDFKEGEVSIDVKPDGIHIMKKENLENIYPNCEVLKNNNIELADGELEVDLSQLIKGSKIDEDGYLVSGSKKYDLTGAKLTIEIPLDKIDIYDDTESGQISGVIVSSIYKGDHYRIIVRSEDDEEFIVDTNYENNLGDQVRLDIKKEDIKIRLKGAIEDYEI